MKNEDYPATRAAAKKLGLSRYFTGKPCSKGHVDLRFLTGTCVSCQRLAIAAWDKRNPGESTRRAKKYYHHHPERVKAASKRSWRKGRGIPEAPYPCPANCECCGKLLETGKRTHLDHDHVTGQFRGWLCNACNLGVGMLGDSIEGVKRALVYLERAASPETSQPPRD